MVDYREILRYSSLGYSRKQISLTVHSSHHTVEDTLNAAQEKGIAWPFVLSRTILRLYKPV